MPEKKIVDYKGRTRTDIQNAIEESRRIVRKIIDSKYED